MAERADVTYQRVTDALAAVGIPLLTSPIENMGYSRVNGFDFYCAVIPHASTFVRLDWVVPVLNAATTDEWYTAVNTVNSVLRGVKASILDDPDELTLRTESCIITRNGLNDTQLEESLRLRIDYVLAAMNRLQTIGPPVTPAAKGSETPDGAAE